MTVIGMGRAADWTMSSPAAQAKSLRFPGAARGPSTGFGWGFGARLDTASTSAISDAVKVRSWAESGTKEGG